MKSVLLKLTIVGIVLFSAEKMAAQTGVWTWMKGGNFAPVYGVKGVPAPNNTPPVTAGSMGWTDKQGNFWLYGGNENDWQQVCPNNWCTYDQVWKYNVSSNMWAWMFGHQATAIFSG